MLETAGWVFGFIAVALLVYKTLAWVHDKDSDFRQRRKEEREAELKLNGRPVTKRR